MSVKRKKYSPQCKSQIVQEVLAGEKTLAQIASENSIHPNVITKWKAAVLTAIPKAFNQLKAQNEKEKEELYAQIGRLSTQLRWLFKKARSVGITLEQAKRD
jgi:transposase-like protein